MEGRGTGCLGWIARIGMDGAWYTAGGAGVWVMLGFSSCEVVKRTPGGMEGGSCCFGVSVEGLVREMPIRLRMVGDMSDLCLRWETREARSGVERLFLCVRIDTFEPGFRAVPSESGRWKTNSTVKYAVFVRTSHTD